MIARWLNWIIDAIDDNGYLARNTGRNPHSLPIDLWRDEEPSSRLRWCKALDGGVGARDTSDVFVCKFPGYQRSRLSHVA